MVTFESGEYSNQQFIVSQGSCISQLQVQLDHQHCSRFFIYNFCAIQACYQLTHVITLAEHDDGQFTELLWLQ